MGVQDRDWYHEAREQNDIKQKNTAETPPKKKHQILFTHSEAKRIERLLKVLIWSLVALYIFKRHFH